MSEREYHDAHYAGDAAAIFGSPLFARVHDRVARDFLARTGAGRRHRLLSLGCGDGSLERRLAPFLGEIVGIDVSPVAIARAAEITAAAGLRNVTFVVSGADRASLERHGAFDRVAAFAFLHHLEDSALRDTMAAVRGVLRPDGLFYSIDPSCRRLVGRLTWLVRHRYERYHSPGERELDPECLAAIVAAAGFSLPLVAYTDYFLGPLAWLSPGTPAWLAAVLEALDNWALRAPFVRRYASSFSLLAQAG